MQRIRALCITMGRGQRGAGKPPLSAYPSTLWLTVCLALLGSFQFGKTDTNGLLPVSAWCITEGSCLYRHPPSWNVSDHVVYCQLPAPSRTLNCTFLCLLNRLPLGDHEHGAVLALQGRAPGLRQGGGRHCLGSAGGGRGRLPVRRPGRGRVGPEEGAAPEQRLAAGGERAMRCVTRRLWRPAGWCVRASLAAAELLLPALVRACVRCAMHACMHERCQPQYSPLRRVIFLPFWHADFRERPALSHSIMELPWAQKVLIHAPAPILGRPGVGGHWGRRSFPLCAALHC